MSENTSRAQECLGDECPLAVRRQSARVSGNGFTAQNDEFAEPAESESLRLVRKRLGRKPQVGGALAMFIGALLFLFTAPAAPGALAGLHKLAAIFIVIGACLFAIGTLARRYYLT